MDHLQKITDHLEMCAIRLRQMAKDQDADIAEVRAIIKRQRDEKQ